jgi:hypothetical protein
MDISVHEKLASQTFNRCWDLLDGERSPDADRELITNAFASRYHWHQVGGAEPLSIADWMISRAYVAIGQPIIGLQYARHAESQIAEKFPAWLKASIYEGVARASKACGDELTKQLYIGLAHAELAYETKAEDAGLILSQLEEL